MMENFGWLPDWPDVRDYTLGHESADGGEVQRLLQELHAPGPLPPRFDCSKYCSPVEAQKDLGSCVSQACVGMMEFYQRLCYDKHVDLSRLFHYWVARRFRNWQNRDSGSFLRDGMKALAAIGVCPEKNWPYRTSDYALEPEQFAFALARNFCAEKYYRLDSPGDARDQLLRRIKNNIRSNMPVIFGFTVYESIRMAEDNGKIPYPTYRDRRTGGHAVMTVGYDDSMDIMGQIGALKIRNSWGAGWGAGGYGWLPYTYVLNWQSADFWSMVDASWIDLDVFK